MTLFMKHYTREAGKSSGRGYHTLRPERSTTAFAAEQMMTQTQKSAPQALADCPMYNYANYLARGSRPKLCDSRREISPSVSKLAVFCPKFIHLLSPAGISLLVADQCAGVLQKMHQVVGTLNVPKTPLSPPPSIVGRELFAIHRDVRRLAATNIQSGRCDQVDTKVFHASFVVTAFLQGSHTSA